MIPNGVIRYFDALKRNSEIIKGWDYGRGVASQYQVGELARKSASQSFEAATLARICKYHQCGRVLELGSNLGKSISFMASINPETKFIGLEGNEGLANFSNEGLRKLDLKNAKIQQITFSEFFSQNADTFDMVFIDGDHRFEPTMINYSSSKSILKGEGPIILHDIYWSKGMQKAWEKIKADNDATVTIDLFFFGLVYFRKGQRKQHFSIRYPKDIIRSLFL